MSLVSQIFTGNNLAIFGAALAVALAGWGSAIGVGLVGQASDGLLSEDPNKFGKTLVLTALPATQGIYGLITAFMVIFKLELLSGSPVQATIGQGASLFFACLPIAIVGLGSAIHQGKVAAAGVSLVAKKEGELAKGITNAAMVETYAIFALLVSLLLINSITVG